MQKNPLANAKTEDQAIMEFWKWMFINIYKGLFPQIYIQKQSTLVDICGCFPP